MDQTLQSLNIAYRWSRLAKNLRITIAPSQAIRVTVPLRISLKRAEEFVQNKQAWIQKHLAKMRQMETLRAEHRELSREELIKAQDDLFARLERFSQKHNLPYRRAGFRCQKTRWGSCSSQNNISLNINIAFLPSHLQDYILLHELCHIPHKSHSKAFWAQLDRCCGGSANLLSKELKTHRMQL